MVPESVAIVTSRAASSAHNRLESVTPVCALGGVIVVCGTYVCLSRHHGIEALKAFAPVVVGMAKFYG